MAELRLENLSKSFPGTRQVRAVQDISFNADSGECVAVLGPSGAGKSTILRLIAGLETPTAGRILIDGEAVENRRSAERQVGMAFQYPALLPQLSVGENLRLGPKLRGQNDAEARVSDMADLLALKPLLARRPETLSGGEQQRVALGRALVARPRVLLLDEPLASLDPLARVELRDVIRRIQKELRLTTLYVSHDQAEAAAVADRIVLLRAGSLQQFSTPRELYSNPGNLFCARFYGLDGLNLLPVKLSQRGSAWVAEADTVVFPLPREPRRLSGDLAIAFRPSAAKIALGAGQWLLTGFQDLGWIQILRLTHEDKEIVVQSSNDLTPQTGRSLKIEVDPNALFLFDRGTGERLL